MYDYRLNRVVQEEGSATVAYVDVLDEATGKIIRTVCVAYTTKEAFQAAMENHTDRIALANTTRLTIEQEIRTVLIEVKADIATKG